MLLGNKLLIEREEEITNLDINNALTYWYSDKVCLSLFPSFSKEQVFNPSRFSSFEKNGALPNGDERTTKFA